MLISVMIEVIVLGKTLFPRVSRESLGSCVTSYHLITSYHVLPLLIPTGGSPTNLTALQDEFDGVLLSWAAPTVPPNGGYSITADPGGIDVVTPSSPFRVAVRQPGLYSFRVSYISQHLPGGTVGLDGVTVRGKGDKEVSSIMWELGGWDSIQYMEVEREMGLFVDICTLGFISLLIHSPMAFYVVVAKSKRKIPSLYYR